MDEVGQQFLSMYKFIILGASMMISGCTIFSSRNQLPVFADNPVIAHRGAFKANGFPENSIAALREAIRLQCSGSEFDVWMTADDSLVINHDPDYKGIKIEKATFHELRRIPLSNGEIIPTLREYLQSGKQGNKATRLVLEIKPSAGGKERGSRIAEKVVAMVRELHLESMVYYISFDFNVLLRIRELNPKAHLQYLEGNKSPDELSAAGISGLDFHYSVFQKKPQWVDSARMLKLQLNAWTVNDTTLMDWFLDRQFDFITTNEPEILLKRFYKSQGK